MAITVELNEWTFDEWLDSGDGQWFPYDLLLYPVKNFVAKDEVYYFIAKNETYHRVAKDEKYYFVAEDE